MVSILNLSFRDTIYTSGPFGGQPVGGFFSLSSGPIHVPGPFGGQPVGGFFSLSSGPIHVVTYPFCIIHIRSVLYISVPCYTYPFRVKYSNNIIYRSVLYISL